MFICGSLEPGHDGVGDYVRRLGSALLKAGHSVSAVALEDHYVKKTQKENQASGGALLPVLRIPQGQSSAYKRLQVRTFTDALDPEMISLQYVPYSFHAKGIPFSLINNLRPLVAGCRFHVLFHELWLDTPIGAGQKITAWLQRKLIGRLISKLKPEVVHVTVEFNRERLERIGVDAGVLGLFGNIYPDEETANKEIVFEDTLNISSAVLYFGEPPKGIFRSIFLAEVARFCSTHQHGLRLVLACGNSAAKDEFCRLLRKSLDGYAYEIIDCGFLSVGTLSVLMNRCNAGISKSKPHLLAKSGAAVAMLEHGLPIWAPRWDGTAALGVEFRKELVFSDLVQAITSAKPAYHSLVEDVAKAFVNQLKAS
ncbi:MAG TPA: glycosyltransferase [Pedobacter sp.]|nr:glycosyltransferase [Pedobacter sp.]